MLLNLPDAPATVVADAIVATLKADPTLAAVAYNDPETGTVHGLAVEAWPRDVPADRLWLPGSSPLRPADPAVIPCVRLIDAGGSGRWFEERRVLETWGLRVELWVPGTDAADVRNLWYALERALFPADPGRYRAIKATWQAAVGGVAHLNNLTFRAPPAAAATFGSEPRGLVAVGSIDFSILV